MTRRLQRVLPYGAWPPAVTADVVTAGSVRIGQLAAGTGDGPRLWWSESRPDADGRNVLVAFDGDRRRDVTPPPWDVCSRAHEYGGGAFTACGGEAWFTDAGRGQICRVAPDGRITPFSLPPDLRVADLLRDHKRRRLICVAERAADGDGNEPVNSLIAIGDDGRITELAGGADFYASPRLSPDGARLAWLQWRHPDMPWDATELREATLDRAGAPGAARAVAGGDGESVFQPEYGPDGALHYVSDRSGFWNIYRDGAPPRQYALAAECGLPQWQFGMRTYGFLADGRIVFAHAVAGDWRLGTLDPRSGAVTIPETPFCSFDGLVCSGGRAWFVAGRRDGPQQIVQFDIDRGDKLELRAVAEPTAAAEDISVARPLPFNAPSGEDGHAWYYPPANGRCGAPKGEKPPLIVRAHGGPTAQALPALALKTQFWTGRGFAVLDVNYGGSTGFGRAFRRRLEGQWGVVDVEDCIAAARAAVAQGLAGPRRLCITGSSAGGFTALCALAFHDAFAAGCSLYGVADPAALLRDTHKFESRYLQRLIGPWPQARALYEARSPRRHVGRIRRPLLFLQGLEDRVVPPAQTEQMVKALRAAGGEATCEFFPGEGHGFRRPESIRRALAAELRFYGALFGFTPAP